MRALPIALFLALTLLATGCPQYELTGKNATAIARVEKTNGELAPTAAIPYPDSFIFDGSESYVGNNDQAATKFRWTWYLVPDGCDWELDSSDGFDDPHSVRTTVHPSALGTYMASLRAESETGGISTNLAVATAFAINLQGLEFRLTWDADTTDMDLHVINGASLQGAYWSDNDCYFGNPTPDWGMPGEGLDNPVFIEDIDTGYGPESINIQNPADGVYAVAAAYHNDWDTGITTVPEVGIYVDGVQIHSFSGSQLQMGSVQFMGTFSWPDASGTNDGSVFTHLQLGGPPYNE